MRVVLRYFHHMRLATKQFIFLVICSSILFAVGGWYALKNAEVLLKNQLEENAQVVLARTDEYLNVYLDNINGLLLTLAERKELFDLSNQDDTIEILRSYAENYTGVNMLYILHQKGNVITNKQVYYHLLGNPHLQQVIDISMQNYGSINWTEPYVSPLSQRTIAFAIPVYGDDKVYLGTIAVEIDLYLLQTKISNLMENKFQSFVIYSIMDELILMGRNNQLLPIDFKKSYALDERVQTYLAEMSNGTHILSFSEDGEWVAVKTSQSIFGWQLIALIDKSYYFRSITYLYKIFIQGAVIWFMILLIGSYIFSRYFSKPILTLVQKMNRVQSLEIFSEINIQRGDEIGQLSLSYNNMMRRIQLLTSELKLTEQAKRKFEMELLQSQIGPHFLYNTLACIESLSFQKRNEDVQTTIRSLVGLLSYSVNNQDERVTFKQEIDAINQYVQIQKVRFGDKFEMDIHMDESVMDYEIPKLILQPLVENAIIHGFASTNRKGVICIRGRQKGDRMIIIIADNGLGMDDETLRGVFTKHKRKFQEDHSNHIGIVNVYERLVLYFGERSRIRIRSRIRKGTLIRIVLPHVD
ncbi:sensor histidine kinase [Paenibacillus sp. GXUN7292]|uniref:sensor histidine kinase n=1 Tax=Paenibacillus sp. GXUN7292 TaxID=3422499 RepID=UPI003D7C8194